MWNEGTWGTKHVGRGTVGLKTAINALNQHFSFVVPLIHYDNNGNGTKGKPHGEVIVRGYLAADVKAAVSATATADPAPQPAPIARAAVSDKGEKSSEEFNSQSSKQSGAVYDETKPLVLRLDQLQARGLKDKGGTWDKQDPALRITVGDAKPFDTER